MFFAGNQSHIVLAKIHLSRRLATSWPPIPAIEWSHATPPVVEPSHENPISKRSTKYVYLYVMFPLCVCVCVYYMYICVCLLYVHNIYIYIIYIYINICIAILLLGLKVSIKNWQPRLPTSIWCRISRSSACRWQDIGILDQAHMVSHISIYLTNTYYVYIYI